MGITLIRAADEDLQGLGGAIGKALKAGGPRLGTGEHHVAQIRPDVTKGNPRQALLGRLIGLQCLQVQKGAVLSREPVTDGIAQLDLIELLVAPQGDEQRLLQTVFKASQQ